MIFQDRHRIRPHAHRSLPGRAFTLIELLVVISIIGIVVAISFPFLRSMVRSSSIQIGADQVDNAVTSARAYATQFRQFVTGKNVGGVKVSSNSIGDGFSGSAVLFANDGTMRILLNDENAWDASGGGWMELKSNPQNGYKHIEALDDLRLPGRVWALGLVRTGSATDEVQLVPPPFMVLIDRRGTITAGSTNNLAYYNGLGTTTTVGAITGDNYRTTLDRSAAGATFDPAEFGRQGTERRVDGRIQTPFDAVETVAGVVLLDPDQVPEEFEGVATGFDRNKSSIYTVPESLAILGWCQAQPTHNRVVFFNRYTGKDVTR